MKRADVIIFIPSLPPPPPPQFLPPSSGDFFNSGEDGGDRPQGGFHTIVWHLCKFIIIISCFCLFPPVTVFQHDNDYCCCFTPTSLLLLILSLAWEQRLIATPYTRTAHNSSSATPPPPRPAQQPQLGEGPSADLTSGLLQGRD